MEVLDNIAQNASTTDQASLSAASKLMNEVTTRHLYRNISVKLPHEIVRCCKTLVQNVAASAAVRQFCMEKSGPSQVLGYLL